MLQERDLPEHYRVWRREDGLRDLKPGPLYKATDLRANRIVVLRFFEQDGLDALVRRTSLLLQAGAPGIAALRDVFTKDQTLVTVTDFVVGESLVERVARRGPLAPEFVWEMAVQGIEALAALHGRGIRHGQLGPSKIFFPDDASRNGLIQLVDCGLPRPGETGVRPPGDDESEVPDDFRRLGISLWFALTGHFPFGGNPAVFAEDAPITEPLLAAFTTLLCGEPDRQPNSTRLLLEALQAPQVVAPARGPAGETSPAPPPVNVPVVPQQPSPSPVTRSVEPTTGRKGASALAIPLPSKPSAKSGEPTAVAGAKSLPLVIPAPSIVPPGKKDRTETSAPTIPASPAPPETPEQKKSSAALPAPEAPVSPNAVPDGREARPRRSGGRSFLLWIALIGVAAASLVIFKPWMHPRTGQMARPEASPPPPVATATIAPQPPRPAPLQARVDRIQEHQPSLLSVLQFARQMQRVTTVLLPIHSGPPDDATVARLKDAFEWERPASPNFHRTAMLFVMGGANDPPEAQRLAVSQQCAEDWANALTRSGFASPVYACGLGAAAGLPDVQAAARSADRFVEVWVAFTLM